VHSDSNHSDSVYANLTGKRIILHEKSRTSFWTASRRNSRNWFPAIRWNPQPLCTKGALELIENQINTAVGGAKVLLGRETPQPARLFPRANHPDRSYAAEPGLPPGILLSRQERSEAIDLANDSPYGLSGSVITKDVERGKRVARQIETGIVFINATTWTAPDLPFGGIKNSGYGRELSELGIGEFVNKKLVRVAA